MIIGLSGFARSGKDEAAKILVEEFYFQKLAFADILRDALYALNPVVIPSYQSGLEVHPTERYGPLLIQEIIDSYTWDGYKETTYGPEIRRLLQRMGTEVGRNLLGGNIWIDKTLENYSFSSNPNAVISDARFLNEFDAIRREGGEIWRIDRLGVGPANDHPSEMEALTYRAWDRVIHNNGTLEDYHNKIRKIMGRMT